MLVRTSTLTVRRLGGWACLILWVLSTDASLLQAQSANTENTLKLDSEVSRPAAAIESLDWLAGYWRGESSLGRVEEIWTPPSHGTMVSAFKVVRDNETEPYFYEFVEISEEDGGLTLKVKHFNADLEGWEEKKGYVAFPLVKLGEREAYFSGLTYRRTGDELRAWVAIDRGEDGLQEIEFVYKHGTPSPR